MLCVSYLDSWNWIIVFNRVEAQEKMVLLREKSEKDIQQHNAEMKELIRIIDHDYKLREFMNTKGKDRDEDKQLVTWRDRKGTNCPLQLLVSFYNFQFSPIYFQDAFAATWLTYQWHSQPLCPIPLRFEDNHCLIDIMYSISVDLFFLETLYLIIYIRAVRRPRGRRDEIRCFNLH